MNKREVIVIGGGHAGVEATFALAKLGHKVTLITIDINNIAMMPCNPSIGGPAKGIITKEIDALGGVQAFYADKSMIQIKMLNNSKGPAIRALRAQVDKIKFSKIIIEDLKLNKNIELVEDIVTSLIFENKKVVGVKTKKNQYKSDYVILTTGTYLDSYILRGKEKIKEGPDGQSTTSELSISLKKNGIELQRLKTGTPARVLTSSIDFSKVEKEIIELNNFSFSARSGIKLNEQISCYLTYTNEETHKIVDEHINESSMYSGVIKGVGPRYCPSIEDKIVRFRDKPRHQIFYEPETKEGDTIYVNGFSTSMPIYVQNKLLKTLREWKMPLLLNEHMQLNMMQLIHCNLHIL